MQNAAGGGVSVQSDGPTESSRVIVSNLVSLIEQVEANIRLIESVIVGESQLGNQEAGGNVVVLDDVTPRYMSANAALHSCNAGLGVALHFLRDARTSEHRADQPAEGGRRLV